MNKAQKLVHRVISANKGVDNLEMWLRIYDELDRKFNLSNRHVQIPPEYQVEMDKISDGP